MNHTVIFQILVGLTLSLPMVALLTLAGTLLFGRRPSEKFTSRLTSWMLAAVILSVLGAALLLFRDGERQVVVSYPPWFSLGSYSFELEFLVDGLSLPFVLLTVVLSGLVGRFSASYLHRDPGFLRFFVLLLLFVSGMTWLVLGGTIDLLFAGWELVGLASAMLIAFFPHRKEPVENALRTWAVYRFCDVGLLAAAVLMHHYAHTAQLDSALGQAPWPSGLPHIHGVAVELIMAGLLFAAIGKSAQLPFGGWLPRAMEGPTPSSAIFYGGISIHAGAYLLLRSAPLLDRAPIVRVLVIVVGVATALYGMIVGRVQSDAKNQLAFASMAQVGLIFAEIGLGLRFFALLHIAGHASVRTLQFLRAPSVLREFNRISAAQDGQLSEGGLFYELLIPARLRTRLYAFALAKGGMEAMLRAVLIRPVFRVARALEQFESSLGHEPGESASSNPRLAKSDLVEGTTL